MIYIHNSYFLDVQCLYYTLCANVNILCIYVSINFAHYVLKARHVKRFGVRKGRRSGQKKKVSPTRFGTNRPILTVTGKGQKDKTSDLRIRGIVLFV